MSQMKDWSCCKLILYFFWFDFWDSSLTCFRMQLWEASISTNEVDEQMTQLRSWSWQVLVYTLTRNWKMGIATLHGCRSLPKKWLSTSPILKWQQGLSSHLFLLMSSVFNTWDVHEVWHSRLCKLFICAVHLLPSGTGYINYSVQCKLT